MSDNPFYPQVNVVCYREKTHEIDAFETCSISLFNAHISSVNVVSCTKNSDVRIVMDW